MQVFYILKCTCKWWRKCLGTTESLKDLVEFKPCATCHGPRKFKCPKCGKIIKAVRAEYPDLPETEPTAVAEIVVPPEPEPVISESPPVIPSTLTSPAIPPVGITTVEPGPLAWIKDATLEEVREFGRLLAKRFQEVKDAPVQEKK